MIAFVAEFRGGKEEFCQRHQRMYSGKQQQQQQMMMILMMI